MEVHLSTVALACLCAYVALPDGVSAQSDVPVITSLGVQETLSDVEVQNIANLIDGGNDDGDVDLTSTMKQEGQKAVDDNREARQNVLGKSRNLTIQQFGFFKEQRSFMLQILLFAVNCMTANSAKLVG